MANPTRAVILAAGFGSRMWPLTRVCPKALLPYQGEALLYRSLRMLREWGVREVLVNAHHLGEQVMKGLVDQPLPGLRIQLSYEPEILGTGGALVKAGWFLDEQPTWMLNADILAGLDPAPLIRHHRRHRPFASLWMHEQEGPRTVRLDGDRVVDFADPAPGSPGTATFCGLHLMDRRVLDYLPAEGCSSIITAYRGAMAAGEVVDGLILPDATWADLGTPEQVVAAHEGGFIDSSARVAARAVVRDSVIGAGAELRAGARVERALVGPNTLVHGRVTRLAVPATQALEPEVLNRLPRWCAKATADCLAPRGSDRTFFRLQTARQRGILMRSGSARPENERFASHARFLAKAGVDVPEVLLHQPGLLLVEDLGDDELLARPTEARFRACIPLIQALHRVRVPRGMKLEKSFTKAYLEWEHDLFLTHFEGGPVSAAVRRDLRALATRLARAPRVLLHRDLQSTNLLFHRGVPHFIDFQGMRMGPAMYDVASFLADPYVNLSAATQHRLLHAYTEDPELLAQYPLACVQRLLQALGAYGRLGAQAGTRRFLAHIPAGLAQLQRALHAQNGLPNLREFIDHAVSKLSVSG